MSERFEAMSNEQRNTVSTSVDVQNPRGGWLTGHAQDLDVQRPLSTVLTAAAVESALRDVATASKPTDYARPMPPQDGTPIHATQAHKNISVYGEAYAVYLEKAGEEVLAAAQEYHDYCFKMAALARDEYKVEADRASKFIENVQKRAKALDVVARNGDD